ncbi:MAG: nucleotidyl transferase AbiEii/AbiGii toxin family protein, partial [Desulfobacterales bacterium]|nr:nucleotidyl transferase AbiEii/AbiGii toxin family protein [Desulfobacterales bacterium]
LQAWESRMSVSLEYLQRCSIQTGYQVRPLEKVVRLGEMAGEVARHPFLRSVLALKGGTALNLCFGPPKRLSIDLDFNYTGHRDREQMLADRPRVEQAVADIARRKGYRVQQSRDAFAGRKIYFIYRSVLGPEERIELDLNFLFRVPIAGTEQRELWQPGELDRPEVRTVSLQEIVVGKMLAMLDRGAARDVWDLANLPQPANDVKGLPSFRPWFIALAAILDHPLPTYTLSRLKGLVTERAVVEQLAPMLSVDAPRRADDLVKQAWAVLSDFLTLSPNEVTYIASIERGEVRPELLFADDPEAAQRVTEHPAILWKVINVREHLAR